MNREKEKGYNGEDYDIVPIDRWREIKKEFDHHLELIESFTGWSFDHLGQNGICFKAIYRIMGSYVDVTDYRISNRASGCCEASFGDEGRTLASVKSNNVIRAFHRLYDRHLREPFSRQMGLQFLEQEKRRDWLKRAV